MKYTYSPMQKVLLISAAVLLIVSVSACSRKVSFLTSSVVPAAQGTVKVKKDNNKNYNIQIDLTNLAETDRLSPSRNMYVVWMESQDNPVKNIGQIKSSKGFISSKLKASFSTVSTDKPTRIFITAEDEAGIQSPGAMVVLSTKVF